MPETPPPTQPAALRPWHDAQAGDAITSPGDVESARLWLAHTIGDDAVLAALRVTTLVLADGTELSRLDEHQLVDHLAAAVANGRLRAAGSRPALRRLVAAAPAPAPAPPAAAPARRAAPVAPPAPVETTFGSELDVAAMVAVLVQAAQDGVPFCEECAQAAAEAAA
jgi:hypothetical protein